MLCHQLDSDLDLKPKEKKARPEQKNVRVLQYL
jgi:hypothetical protein